MKRNYRSLDDVQVEYFEEHPEEIDIFVEEVFEDYAEDGDASILLASLRVIAQVKGVSKLAEKIGMTRRGLQKALSENGNPRLDNINAILRALGYKLKAERVSTTSK